MSRVPNLHEEIVRAEQIPISGMTIKCITDDKARIIPYSSLGSMSHINELFTTHECAIVLYELQGNVGHWVAIMRDKPRNTIRFYNSYALPPDGEINLFKHKAPFLSRLLANSGYNLDVNVHQHQLFRDHTQTCGRHCGLRCLYSYLTNSEYHMFITGKPKIANIDELVAAMTMICVEHTGDSKVPVKEGSV